MKLYLISQTQNTGYDSYDSAIVCADSEKEAQLMHPDGEPVFEDNPRYVWCDSPLRVSVKHIGEAAEGIEKGVVLTSFNAG